MTEYLPRHATIEQSCSWLGVTTGETWNLARLLECGLLPWFWLDYAPGWPAIFGDRLEGYLAPMIFAGDTQRLEADGTGALVTMTKTPEGTPFRIDPGMQVPLSEIRFMREDIRRLAEAQLARGVPEQTEVENESKPNPGAPAEGRQRWQEKQILRVLEDLGYDPLALPRPPAGQSGAKAQARRRLPDLTLKVFDKAWERLREFGDIADAN